MARDAEFGLFIWDLASAGTLSNILELFSVGKKSVVYVKKYKKFFNIKSDSDVMKLISMMSDKAKDEADRKIGLRSKLSMEKNSQIALQF